MQLDLSISPRCYPPKIRRALQRWRTAVSENRSVSPQDRAAVLEFLAGEHQRLQANHLLAQLGSALNGSEHEF